MAWTLQPVGGSEKSLADWGVAGLARTLRSLSASEVFFSIPAAFDAALPFTHRVGVTIRRDRTGSVVTYAGGSIWFYGIVLAQTPSAQGSAERCTVQLADPWWFLENLVYCQRFYVFTGWTGGIVGGTPLFAQQQTSHVMLGQQWLDYVGTNLNTRGTLEEVVDFAADNGAPIAFVADTFPAMTIPKREETDITCADVIRRQLDYIDAVSYFDYTTTPPTLKIVRRSGLAAVSRSVVGCKDITLTPRYDLQLPFVYFKFEKTYTDAGGDFVQINNSYYPDPLPAEKFGGLMATLVLQPSLEVTQELTIADLDTTDPNFWGRLKPELGDENLYASLTILSHSVVAAEAKGGWAIGDAVNLPHYVVDGAIADWMVEGDGDPLQSSDPLQSIKVTAQATVSYTVYRNVAAYGGTNIVKVYESAAQVISADLLATNATGGIYHNYAEEIAGDDPADFFGLAHTIFDDFNVLNWSGQLTLVEAECSGTISLGNVLNLSAGNAAWTSMNATVQAMTEDIDTGTTQISLGVNKHLNVGQLSDLLRVNRSRWYTYTFRGYK